MNPLVVMKQARNASLPSGITQSKGTYIVNKRRFASYKAALEFRSLLVRMKVTL